MINSICELGKYDIKHNHLDKIDILIDAIDQKRETYVYYVDISTSEGYLGVSYEEASIDFSRNYLLKKKSSQGANYSPTAKITEAKKTVKNRLLGYFKAIEARNLISHEKYIPEMNKLHSIITSHKQEIIESINDNPVPKQAIGILTLRVDQKPLIEHPAFKETFLESTLQPIDKSLKDQIATCAICGEKKLIYGPADSYSFFTVDKPGFLRNGFSYDREWKNYPVCHDCRLGLTNGKKFIERHLSFKFHGLSYYIIPKFALSTAEQQDEIINILCDEVHRELRTSDKSKMSLLTNEEDIMGIIKDQQDHMTVSILFLEKKPGSSAERIHCVIPEIFPSRLKIIFDAQKEARNQADNETFIAGESMFFFADSSYKTFLKMAQAIFFGNHLSHPHIVSYLMQKIRSAFFNQNDLFFKARDAITLMIFFHFLSIFPIQKGDLSMERNNSYFDEFFSSYQLQVNTLEKQGLVIMGALCQRLLNIQYKQRGNKPFYKELKGLKMNQIDIKGLLPKIVNKLTEYDAFYKNLREMAAAASDCLLSSAERWPLTVDEINYYFICGMLLSNQVAKNPEGSTALDEEKIK